MTKKEKQRIERLMKRNAEYWERRAADRMVDYMAEAEKTASDLGQAYYAASEAMKYDMHRIFGSFQRAFSVSEAEAKRIFASVGNENAMKSLRMAAEKIADPEQRKLALDAITSAPAYTWRIARLDSMLGNVSETCNRLYKTDLKKTTDFLGEITGKAYNRAVYDLQVGTETVGAAFDLLPESRVTQILRTNWSGKHYSARIYADVKDMEGKLKQALLESMFTGESEHKIAEKVAERWQIGYNDARRLIRTETNYVSNQAELESYRSAGVKEYTFTAVLDSRTSEICAELDGKKFPVDKAKAGVNLPPMHPYCRSTTIAVIEDDIWEMSDEEIDKILNEIDEDLGLNEDVPFEDWLGGLKKTEDGKVRYVGKALDKLAGSGIIKNITDGLADSKVHFIGKIDVEKYQPIAQNKILTDQVVLTNNREEHIIERRGQEFYEKYAPFFADIISDPDYIFKDKYKNTALVSKKFEISGEWVNIVLRLIVEGENPDYKNSIITAVLEGEKRFSQRLRNNVPIFVRLDKTE